jgi:hypothetical protein
LFGFVMDFDDLMAVGPAYAVAVGRTVGVFSTWAECEQATSGVQYAVYQAFPSTLAAMDWLQESRHKERPIRKAVDVYIARRKDCIVLWYPKQPTATKVFRVGDMSEVSIGLLGLVRALEHTALHDANVYYSDGSCVMGYNYFLKGWIEGKQASPQWQQIYNLASARQCRLVLKYVPKTDPEMDYALYVAELYWRNGK